MIYTGAHPKGGCRVQHSSPKKIEIKKKNFVDKNISNASHNLLFRGNQYIRIFKNEINLGCLELKKPED
jgi:hypothetical protein